MAHHEHLDEAILWRRRRRRRPQKHIGRDVADRHWEKEGQVGPALQKEVELREVMRSFDGGEQKREHSSSVRSGVCVVRGGDIRGTHARAAHSCDRPHRLKRCGVTMVSRIATSVWRAQSRVRAALACEANRARARAHVRGWHLPCSLQRLLHVPARSPRADARVSSGTPQI